MQRGNSPRREPPFGWPIRTAATSCRVSKAPGIRISLAEQSFQVGVCQAPNNVDHVDDVYGDVASPKTCRPTEAAIREIRNLDEFIGEAPPGR
jgi:hypothetical protein